jgi:hypothetical protein
MQYTKEQYTQIHATWRTRQQHSAAQHVIYNLLRGMDPRRGFTNIKSSNKIISNCNDAWHGFHQACQVARGTYSSYRRPDIWRRIDGKLQLVTAEDPAVLQKKCEDLFLAQFGVELTDELRELLKQTEADK